MFADRADAAEQLVGRLPPLDPARTVVVALPRGGVPIAAFIAKSIGAPLDVVLVRKVGLPGQEELALAAVTDGDHPKLAINTELAQSLHYSEEQILDLARPHLAEIERRRKLYLGGRPALPVRSKTVLVVDDGIATGATMRSALELLRAQDPARLIVAVPVAAEDSLTEIFVLADAVICLSTPRPFIAVGSHYRRFEQVSDQTVIDMLAEGLRPDLAKSP